MKKPFSLLLSILILLLSLLPCAAAAGPEEVFGAAETIVGYKKSALGLSPEEKLFAGDFLKTAGSTAGDWYPFGLAALGLEDDFDAYLRALRANVRERYEADGTLSENKATEWHRITLAALSCGADPTRFCVTAAGEPVDLIADGVFYRKNVGRQGINGYIWALIALNTRDYAAPPDAINTKETLLAALLEKQLQNGGWAAAGDAADVDLTAMALIALAPLTQNNAEAKTAAEKAVSCLSSLQTETGGYVNGGVENCESCAVALTALCCLGIDPDTDARFLKNGRSLLNALLSYRLEDGSFTHAFVADPENPAAEPLTPNDMSCQQALYALAAFYHLRADGKNIFDFSNAPLSDAGWDVLPKAPSKARKAAESLGKKLSDFFADAKNRKTAVAAALALVTLAGAAALIVRRRRRRKA